MTQHQVRLAIAGIGNCASALIQGLHYYAQTNETTGLLHPVLGGYRVTDIVPVVAFDVDARKVGRDLSEAIFAPPNNAYRVPDITVPASNVQVLMGPVLDGVPSHLAEFVQVAETEPVDVVAALKEAQADVLLNCVPTGSAQAAHFYAQAALEAGIGFVNGMPELIVCDPQFQEEARARGVPVIGDDVKSQLGGTVLHRALIMTMARRGVHVHKTYQLNYAGNTDFRNLTRRGESKERTKKEALTSLVDYTIDASAAFAYVPNMKDRKTTRFYFDLANFSNAPLHIDMTLEVEDSANFAGVAVDMVRCCALAKTRGIGGVLTSASAYFCKHPPDMIPDEVAWKMLEAFIVGDRER